MGSCGEIRTHTCSPPLLADIFPQPDLTDDGLARPVLAGIVATICFLAAAILFSTLAACFVNKQRKRKLKRKKGGCIPHPLLYLAQFQKLPIKRDDPFLAFRSPLNREKPRSCGCSCQWDLI